MKQTAVEFLVTKLNDKVDYIPIEMWDEVREIIQQAKEMEKQQIEDAFNAGVNSEDFFYPSTGKLECEIYYEETYKK